MSLKTDKKLYETIQDLTVKCKCGHSIFMPVYLKNTICSHCKKLVFRNNKEEFKYKMERMLKK